MTILQLSSRAAATELLRRRRARAGLIDYARYTNRAYRPAPHHEMIAERLESVASGEIKRLMIFLPPRHGKSELASRRFPAWFLGRNPTRSIIAASYNSDLAGDFGRDVRNIVASPEHAALFPDVMLAADSKAANRWHTGAGGGYAAAGVGTAVTGRGAHVLLIDDPVKDRESADSHRIREKTYRWYLSTAYTRLEGEIGGEDDDPLWRDVDEARERGRPFEGAVVLIQTRWHEDDLAGRLLRDMERGADQWEVLSLPAISEAGAALWPAKFSLQRLDGIKTAQTAREWEALYQQRPTPREGGTFMVSKIGVLDARPSCRRLARRWDLAASEGAGDWTVGVLMGERADGDGYVVLDVQRFRKGAGAVRGLIEAVAKADAGRGAVKLILPQDPGQAGKAQRDSLARDLAAHAPRFERESGSKDTRAEPLAAQVEIGRVSIVSAPWNDAFLHEMATFPLGTHDDQVDAAAGAFNAIAGAAEARMIKF